MPTLLAHARTQVNNAIAAGNTSATLSDATCMVHGLAGADAFTYSVPVDMTLVANGTKGIVQFAAHWTPSIGSEVVLGGNTYTVTDVQTISGCDIGFGLLDRQVTGVNPIKALPVSSTKYGGTMSGLPAIWVVAKSNRIHLLEVLTFQANFSPPGNVIEQRSSVPDPRWSVGTTLVGGDSGSPMVTIVNGELVLLSEAYSVTAGSALHLYRSTCEAAWETWWGIVDTYTDVDLSSFDDYDAALESITVTMTEETSTLAVTCSPGSLGTVYGRVLLQRRRINRVAGRRRLQLHQAHGCGKLYRRPSAVVRVHRGKRRVCRGVIDSYSNSDADTNPNAYSYSYSYTNPDTDSNTYANGGQHD